MEKSKEELIKYLEEFDIKKSLQELTKEEVKEWIEEEWEELIADGANCGEATGIIMDGNHRWMKLSVKNEIFVYEELIKLNNLANQVENAKELEEEIQKLEKEMDRKK